MFIGFKCGKGKEQEKKTNNNENPWRIENAHQLRDVFELPINTTLSPISENDCRTEPLNSPLWLYGLVVLERANTKYIGQKVIYLNVSHF